MIERVKTGIRGLDQVLSGGAPKLSTILMGGLPGTESRGFPGFSMQVPGDVPD